MRFRRPLCERQVSALFSNKTAARFHFLVMVTGQKVVCVDDKVEPEIRKLYDKWISKGTTYVIRDVMLAQNRNGEWGEVGLLLQGVVNPPQSVPPYQERSFNSERFRPIEDKTITESLEQEQYAEIEK
jgi:hypothetical protein